MLLLAYWSLIDENAPFEVSLLYFQPWKMHQSKVAEFKFVPSQWAKIQNSIRKLLRNTNNNLVFDMITFLKLHLILKKKSKIFWFWSLEWLTFRMRLFIMDQSAPFRGCRTGPSMGLLHFPVLNWDRPCHSVKIMGFRLWQSWSCILL